MVLKKVYPTNFSDEQLMLHIDVVFSAQIYTLIGSCKLTITSILYKAKGLVKTLITFI